MSDRPKTAGLFHTARRLQGLQLVSRSSTRRLGPASSGCASIPMARSGPPRGRDLGLRSDADFPVAGLAAGSPDPRAADASGRLATDVSVVRLLKHPAHADRRGIWATP